MALQSGGGKLPGKTAYAGRRRPMTRRSGFKTHEETTGGEFERVDVKAFALKRGQSVSVIFTLPKHQPNDLLGFGGWFHSDKPVRVTIEGGPRKRTLTQYPPPDWNKFGSIWLGSEPATEMIKFTFAAEKDCRLAVCGLCCGIVTHKHLSSARAELLPNMYQFAPEAIFVTTAGWIQLASNGTKPAESGSVALVKKSCNRCGRYLPINTHDERNHLSFSNHCVATNRLPCVHATFSNLRNRSNVAERMSLRHGYPVGMSFLQEVRG